MIVDVKSVQVCCHRYERQLEWQCNIQYKIDLNFLDVYLLRWAMDEGEW